MKKAAFVRLQTDQTTGRLHTPSGFCCRQNWLKKKTGLPAQAGSKIARAPRLK
jgi:hypothetical protein